MLRDSLQRVLVEYSHARQQPFAKHPLANFIRSTVEGDVTQALGEAVVGLKVQGSAGAGNWATVPWVSVFDLTVTDSATRGYYVVYLFNASEQVVYLSLNQGTTAVRAEHGRAAREVLQDRARAIRHRISESSVRFPVRTITLGSTQTLPADYESGHALGIAYNAGAMPTEETLRDDLQQIIAAYRTLTFRGGLDPSLEVEETLDEATHLHGASLVEVRQYRLHRRIERNPLAAKIAKRVLGTRCQCCGFDFEVTFGPLGAGYIEVHHLKPLSALIEGQAVRYDVATDFAVLCANCHRMIHRQADPADLDGLRAQLSSSGSS